MRIILRDYLSTALLAALQFRILLSILLSLGVKSSYICEKILVSSDDTDSKPHCSWENFCGWDDETRRECSLKLCEASGSKSGTYVSTSNDMYMGSVVNITSWYWIIGTNKYMFEKFGSEAIITACCSINQSSPLPTLTSSSPPPPSISCPETCYSRTCDDWDHDFSDGICTSSKGYDLARFFGCECSGCDCEKPGHQSPSVAFLSPLPILFHSHVSISSSSPLPDIPYSLSPVASFGAVIYGLSASAIDTLATCIQSATTSLLQNTMTPFVSSVTVEPSISAAARRFYTHTNEAVLVSFVILRPYSATMHTTAAELVSAARTALSDAAETSKFEDALVLAARHMGETTGIFESVRLSDVTVIATVVNTPALRVNTSRVKMTPPLRSLGAAKHITTPAPTPSLAVHTSLTESDESDTGNSDSDPQLFPDLLNWGIGGSLAGILVLLSFAATRRLLASHSRRRVYPMESNFGNINEAGRDTFEVDVWDVGSCDDDAYDYAFHCYYYAQAIDLLPAVPSILAESTFRKKADEHPDSPLFCTRTDRLDEHLTCVPDG